MKGNEKISKSGGATDDTEPLRGIAGLKFEVVAARDGACRAVGVFLA